MVAQELPPGWDYVSTSSFHTIAIPLSANPSISGIPISSGDYIGVFFWDEDTLKCGGAIEWSGIENTAVLAFGDDNLTTIKDGFDSGEVINWKIYSYVYEDEFESEAAYDPAQPNSDGLYYSHGLSVLLSLTASGPLNAIANAEPSSICIATTAQLFATGYGGSGEYSYSWSSIPVGFGSEEQNPYVTPFETTMYILEIDDGESIAYDSVIIAVTQLPVVYASNDTTICENNSLQLSGGVENASSLQWTTEGDGYFDNDTILTPIYVAGEGDLLSGSVKVTLFVYPLAPCTDHVQDPVYVSFSPLPWADAGEDTEICDYEIFRTSGSSGYSSYILWSSTGDGYFDDPTSTSANYFPGTDDITAGNAELILTAFALAPCTDPTTDTMVLIINQAPEANAGEDQSIAHGTATTLNGTATGGSGIYLWSWSPQELLVDPTVQDPLTTNIGTSTNFTLTVTDETTSCLDSDDMVVYVTGGPLTVIATADPMEICIGNGSRLNAIPSGGSGDYTYSWTSDPQGFISSIPDPDVSPEETTLYIIEIFDGFNTTTGSVMVTVYSKPVAFAGEDIDIPHGTNTTLSGSAAGGSGEYSYSWVPAVYLVDPQVQNPQTINLYGSIYFELTVTDEITNCNDVDSVLIHITGGPLNVAVSANPQDICFEGSSQLLAVASGGSGEYSFSWTSDPPGFSSIESSPVISPEVTTSYFVEVNDGYNTTNGSTSVSVFSLPDVEISAFPNDTVCLFESITLDATTEGAIEYFWFPDGQTTPVISIDSTGIGAGSKTFYVEVTNLNQCIGLDSVTVTFDNCVGVEDMVLESAFRLFPNPASDHIFIKAENSWQFAVGSLQLGQMVIEIYDLYGKLVYKEEFQLNSSNLSIDISSYKSGIYFAVIKSEKHPHQVKKFLISR